MTTRAQGISLEEKEDRSGSRPVPQYLIGTGVDRLPDTRSSRRSALAERAPLDPAHALVVANRLLVPHATLMFISPLASIPREHVPFPWVSLSEQAILRLQQAVLITSETLAASSTR